MAITTRRTWRRINWVYVGAACIAVSSPSFAGTQDAPRIVLRANELKALMTASRAFESKRNLTKPLTAHDAIVTHLASGAICVTFGMIEVATGGTMYCMIAPYELAGDSISVK